MKPALSIIAALCVLISPLVWTPAHAGPAAAQPRGAELDAQAAQARQRIVEIVNQPITHLARTDQAAVFSPGWFHDGAVKPDFNTADVRATQEFPYAADTWVTSDLNPSEMFLGSELEFNANTKYFYIDRTLPKKKLTDAEMLEINSLYRVIGSDEQSRSARWRLTEVVMMASVVVAALLLLFRQTLARSIDAALGRTDEPAVAASQTSGSPRG